MKIIENKIGMLKMVVRQITVFVTLLICFIKLGVAREINVARSVAGRMGAEPSETHWIP